jgi:DNA-binding protein H-NS
MPKARKVSRRPIKSTKLMKTNRKIKRSRTEQPMNDTQLEKLTLVELRELAKLVEKTIGERQINERNSLREKLQEMAEEAGFSLSEVLGGGRGKSRRTVATKFANPADPMETWTGRGRQPRWLTAKLKAGAKLDDFRL